jgi:hypothetical protein
LYGFCREHLDRIDGVSGFNVPSSKIRDLLAATENGFQPMDLWIFMNKKYQLISSTLWLFIIALGNGPFIEVYLLKMYIFNSYVSLPEGT